MRDAPGPADLISQECFRDDLYYRLAGFRVHLPSLRQRDEDVLVLAELFLQRRSERVGGPRRRLGAEACAALRLHSWPGNVRELKSVVERAHIMADNE